MDLLKNYENKRKRQWYRYGLFCIAALMYSYVKGDRTDDEFVGKVWGGNVGACQTHKTLVLVFQVAEAIVDLTAEQATQRLLHLFH